MKDKLWTTGFLFKDRANVRTVQPFYLVQHFNMWSFNSHRILESAKASGITQSDVLVLRWDHFLTRKAILTCSKFLIPSTYKTFYLLHLNVVLEILTKLAQDLNTYTKSTIKKQRELLEKGLKTELPLRAGLFWEDLGKSWKWYNLK